ncbi:tetratricopeptide repeat protein [Geminocystis sp. GBBB08]|uniref:tetratricopeptide repeat protein n=1 Tax=Geminocystis sp. GBBB08 TaxID=2604140 RepID=UPI0027E39DC1|nr:tetratricopeptide repeat protein [Geminocystis sp. GBBB08]MBL1210129.1 tetratricopeptide repeat protein [Geminocystis sp. GBBB08]
MDWKTPLKVQQQDFLNRLALGKLLICDENYLHSEVTIIKKEAIEKIKVESILESEDIANKYNLTYPLQEVLEIIFSRKLAVEAFLSRFGHLVWLDNHKYYEDSKASLVKSNFLVKKATNIKILLKSYQGNFNQIKFCFSSEEINNNEIIVCALSSSKFKNNLQECSIIFLGFSSKYFLKHNKNNNLEISGLSLLYIGGLSYYINDILPLNYPLLEKAKKNLKQGKYEEAISFYTQAIKYNNFNYRPYLLRGICRYKLDQKKEAIADLSQAINLNNTCDLAYHWQGYIYQELGNYSEALVNYSHEIVINSLSFFAYYRRAFVYNKLNKLIEALDDYNIATKINNQFFQVYYNQGNIYYKLGDKESAIQSYNKALKLKPNLAEAYYNIGIIYQESGNYQEAIKNYHLAIKTNNQYYKAYYNLAILQANLGSYQQSINSYEIILRINPNFIQASYNQKSLNSLLKKEGKILSKEADVSPLSDKNPPIISPKKSKEKNNSEYSFVDLSAGKKTNPFLIDNQGN